MPTTPRTSWRKDRAGILFPKIHPAKKNVKSRGFDWLKSFQTFLVLRAKEMQMLAMIAGFGIGFVCVIGCGAAFCLGRCQLDGRPLSFFFKLDPRKTKNKRINTWMFLSIVNIITLRLERCFFVSTRTFWTASKLDHKKTVGSDRARTDHASSCSLIPSGHDNSES